MTIDFALALALLLLTPGPTNTLMALAGAERGWRGALRLFPAEAAAYAVITLPLALAGHALLPEHGLLRPLLTVAAAIWVAYLAVKLWRLPGGPALETGGKGAMKLFTTTLLNPKGLVIGLVLLPSQADPGLAAAAFFIILAAVAAFWAGIGSLLSGRMALSPLLRRACAGWLGMLALWLASAGLAA